MCGIAGILLAPGAADPRRLTAVSAMAAALHHRGPDGGGIWIDREAGVALGHRRLKIVDLSEAGHQPMISQSGGLVITYNGEVYDFGALRSDLEAAGYPFRGHSDTEVMLAAFETVGIEPALRRFAGMFALGLWDREGRVLHLVRDRIGKKPLYVTLVDGALLFASELKALLAFPEFRPTIDIDALAMVLRNGWIPDRQCVWEGVFKLPPGTMLSIRSDDLAGGNPACLRDRVHRWWSLAAVAEQGQQFPRKLSQAEVEAELDRLLGLAVRQRMVADVPLGAFLSGGIDSSMVVALMQAQSPRPVRTFTIGYQESQYDEAADAARVARHLGTDHTEFRLSPADACAVIPELPRIWDEPFADESEIPTLLVAQLARRHVTVALTGDGGDESFAGYSRHFMAPRLASILALPLRPRRAAASALSMLGPEALQHLLGALPLPAKLRRRLSGQNLRKFVQLLDASDECELYERLIAVGSPLPARTLGGERDNIVPPLPNLAARMMYRDMSGYLPGDVLVKVDRASMAVGLEARCPLLDHRVIEFAYTLPTALKIRDGQGKWVLRRVLRRYLPETLFDRPKHGFDVPIGAWLRGPLREWADGLLSRPRLCDQGFLDADRVRLSWGEHCSGRRDRSYELWAVLMVEAWAEAMSRPDAQPPMPGRFESDSGIPAAPVSEFAVR